MLLQKFCRRTLHTTRQLCNSLEKSALSTLRKKTGYTFANCKKALELHNNDVNQAEKWLHEQAQSLGWSKATKLSDRVTTQGLVGVLVSGNRGAMVELNCETDFVARNETFKRFVDHVSRIVLHYTDLTEFDGDLWKLGFESEALRNLETPQGGSLADHLALLIGAVGENASIRRALCFKVNNDLRLAGYAHPAPTNVGTTQDITQVGKYGAIVAYRSQLDVDDPELQKGICQQIVGMKPLKVGEYDKDTPAENKDDETCLIHQEYLLDADKTVGEVLKEHRVNIIDYHRFECGEQTQQHLKEILQAQQQNSN
ncbi:elongation factor Ts, mitochondrial [Drosophila grimshawi]|uniref:Elongation factor Ts, mitochondrial n=1 Tax=Drosophila grimshawi TaxID=7222 RepID=B4JC90_DROGR|nr:elongation factor Ts, mitochondrial [Drosophila grimshawi]EDW04123.1 GH10152 [Drosophila grimshawi]